MRFLAYLLLASLSVSAYAADSLVEYHSLHSDALHRDVAVGVYLPAVHETDPERPLPVLVFLHGMFGNERKWEQRGTDDILDGLIDEGAVPPFFVVCPAGDNSMYVDWASGKADWERFVADELVTWIDRSLPTFARRELRGITGDSMGGYGALHLAFRHPDVFGSVSAHSAAIYAEDPADLPEWIRQRAEHWAPVFGSPIDEDRWRRYNPLHLARTLDVKELRRLHIAFDCGDHDRFGFADTNRELDRILTERKVPHEFHIREGDHGREYYRRYVPESLRFHGRVFRTALAAQRERAPAPSHRGF